MIHKGLRRCRKIAGKELERNSALLVWPAPWQEPSRACQFGLRIGSPKNLPQRGAHRRVAQTAADWQRRPKPKQAGNEARGRPRGNEGGWWTEGPPGSG